MATIIDNIPPIMHPEDGCRQYVPNPWHMDVYLCRAKLNGNTLTIAGPLAAAANPDTDLTIHLDTITADQLEELRIAMNRGGFSILRLEVLADGSGQIKLL